MLLTEPKLATYQEYEGLPIGTPYQLIEGKLIYTPGRTVFHITIKGNLMYALMEFDMRENIGEILPGPLDVHLSNSDVYQPDIIFVRKERVHLMGHDKINIVPNMVVEILTPLNAYYDLTRKKAMYCEHGVEEYWIVDPEQETIEILVKDGEYYRTEALLRKPAELHSPMFPGFSMKLEEVFAF